MHAKTYISEPHAKHICFQALKNVRHLANSPGRISTFLLAQGTKPWTDLLLILSKTVSNLYIQDTIKVHIALFGTRPNRKNKILVTLDFQFSLMESKFYFLLIFLGLRWKWIGRSKENCQWLWKRENAFTIYTVYRLL